MKSKEKLYSTLQDFLSQDKKEDNNKLTNSETTNEEIKPVIVKEKTIIIEDNRQLLKS